jgi:hypothetical protein
MNVFSFRRGCKHYSQYRAETYSYDNTPIIILSQIDEPRPNIGIPIKPCGVAQILWMGSMTRKKGGNSGVSLIPQKST